MLGLGGGGASAGRRLSAKPHLLQCQGRAGEGLIVPSGTSGTGMLMIGHAIPYVQLIPSNFGFSLAGVLGGGFGPGLWLGS